MNDLYALGRLTRVEAQKFWRKPISRAVLAFLIVSPILGEVILAKLSTNDAIYPRVTQFLFSADMLIIIALITVVLSVMALGNDYELGTERVIISRGVNRYQYILSKVIAALGAALVYGFVFIVAGLFSSFFVHTSFSDVPFLDAAGRDIFWRSLGATGVIGLVNFVLSAIVMLALVLGRSSWIGMIAGLGYFFADFVVGGLGSGKVLGIDNAFQYTVTYYAISILEQFFPTDPSVSLPRGWVEEGFADPGWSVILLMLYGTVLASIAILSFRRQDLLTKV
ncbi:MAG: ABC transporter permease subunit [Anaerolineales bacterium]|nr:ABC transporter permease subunit [Anaerolineales bacterium]